MAQFKRDKLSDFRPVQSVEVDGLGEVLIRKMSYADFCTWQSEQPSEEDGVEHFILYDCLFLAACLCNDKTGAPMFPDGEDGEIDPAVVAISELPPLVFAQLRDAVRVVNGMQPLSEIMDAQEGDDNADPSTLGDSSDDSPDPSASPPESSPSE